MTVNILGVEYTIEKVEKTDDVVLQENDAYVDTSLKKIIIENFHSEIGSKGNLEYYEKQVIRHEIIHAFMFESGLDCNSLTTECAWAINEEMIDWFAIQSPKIYKAFLDCDCM